MLQPRDMTHEELAGYAMQVGYRDAHEGDSWTQETYDALRSAGLDLQEAVDNEQDGEALAEKIYEIAGW